MASDHKHHSSGKLPYDSKQHSVAQLASTDKMPSSGKFQSTDQLHSSENRPKVLVTSCEVPREAIILLKSHCDLIINDELPFPTMDQIIRKIKGVDALFWATPGYYLDRRVLDAAGPQLRCVATMSVGIDHLDMHELRARKILVANTPHVLVDAVAEVAMMLLLAATRRLHESRLAIENHEWTWGVKWMAGPDLRNSIVGIVGLGGIGMATARRLVPFGVRKFLYSGHAPKAAGKEINAHFVTFDELVRMSEFIIISCPLTEETRFMFNAEVFHKMKASSVLVNVSRGQIVDQDALILALERRQIFAAGLDVMTPEPLPSQSKLLKCANCVVSPHIGSATTQTRIDMTLLCAKNILAALKGDPMPSQVL